MEPGQGGSAGAAAPRTALLAPVAAPGKAGAAGGEGRGAPPEGTGSREVSSLPRPS